MLLNNDFIGSKIGHNPSYVEPFLVRK